MRSSSEWVAYFTTNLRDLLPIPWELGEELTEEEKAAVHKSVREFQAGESSEGSHLSRYACEHAAETGDADYVPAVRLFIAEEQRHGRDLARFLTLNDIPLVKTTFTDQVFRRLRNLWGGLETSISVLILAEIIAKVYYAALQRATDSRILQQLCVQILRDEVKHVEFQSQRLELLRARHGILGRGFRRGVQWFLFFGTCLVVWLFHGKVMRRGGLGFFSYWHACWFEFYQAWSVLRQPSVRPAVPPIVACDS